MRGRGWCSCLAGGGENQPDGGCGRGLQGGRLLPGGGVQRDHAGHGPEAEPRRPAHVQRRERGQPLLQLLLPQRCCTVRRTRALFTREPATVEPQPKEEVRPSADVVSPRLTASMSHSCSTTWPRRRSPTWTPRVNSSVLTNPTGSRWKSLSLTSFSFPSEYRWSHFSRQRRKASD